MNWNSQNEGSSGNYDTVYVNPRDLRFTQNSIANHFGLHPYQSFSLEEAVEKLQKGLMESSEFPDIEVYKDNNGVMWCNDNRRLFVFRKAGLTCVQAKLFRNPLYRTPPPVAQRQEMGRQDYFPAVRGGVGNMTDADRQEMAGEDHFSVVGSLLKVSVAVAALAWFSSR